MLGYFEIVITVKVIGSHFLLRLKAEPAGEAVLHTPSHQRGQRSSLVAHWLSIPGDHGSNLGGGKNFLFHFLSCDLMITAYLRINSGVKSDQFMNSFIVSGFQ